MKLDWIFFVAVLLIAIGSVLAVAFSYGDMSHVLTNVVRFFDLDAHRVALAGPSHEINMNVLYLGVLGGIIVSGGLDAQSNVRRTCKIILGRILFSLLLAGIFFAHLVDSAGCGVENMPEIAAGFSVAFVLGFTVDELFFKLVRVAKRLGIDH